MSENNKDIIELELGDIIKIINKEEADENNTYIIDYIDKSKMKLINTENLNNLTIRINENGTLGDKNVSEIYLLSRSDLKGYAKQNGLITNIWINLYFGGDVPTIITGQITNLEEDLIEIKVYPSNEVFYINFEYKGLPEDLPIESIEIRNKPFIEKNNEQENENEIINQDKDANSEYEINEEIINLENEHEERNEYKNTQEEEIIIPLKTVKDQIREFVLKADQISFGNEVYGPIVQYVEVDAAKQRYSIETQTNDLLDELLSTIPSIQRTNKVLNSIHIMIERFKQLRSIFSSYDENGNINSFIVHEADWKPFSKYFLEFKQLLYWVLPVVKNNIKLYNVNVDENESNHIENIDLNDDMENIKVVIQKYNSNESNIEQNKYTQLFNDLNGYFTPFNNTDPENTNDIIIDKEVNTDLDVILDNLDNFYSSVTSNYAIKSKRFVVQRYNIGLAKLQAQNLSGSKLIAQRIQLTSPDIMSIKSFLMLPEPVIRFSRINLPGTSILDRANLNNVFLNYWKLLKKNTNISNIIIDNFHKEDQEFKEESKEEEKDLTLNESKFITNVKHYILDLPEEVSRRYSKVELYKEFINTIIPKTKMLFNLIKKHIVGKLSITEVLSFMEPFLIYGSDLTYTQYKHITFYLDKKISEYNKKYVENGRVFASLNKNKSLSLKENSFISILKNTKDILEKYDIHNIDNKYSSSELLNKLIDFDYGNIYHYSFSVENISFLFPDNLIPILEKNKNINLGENNEGSCNNFVIAKQYETIQDLELDNENDTIYFDKKFDETPYNVIDNYQKEINQMTPEDFLLFLIEKLKKTFNLKKEEDAEYLADTLLSGIKKVIDGQYAIVYNTSKNKMNYYVRKHNKWETDDSIDDNVIANTNELLCNIQEKCVNINTKLFDKCESISNLKQNNLNELLVDFDNTYLKNKQFFEEELKKKLEYYDSIADKLKEIYFNNLFKYNNQQYSIGSKTETDNMKEIITSPYEKIRDLILSESDFIKKQQDIIRFKMEFTRDFINGIGPLGEDESKYWLYCKKTNIKLLPTFIYQLASAFIMNPSSYNETIDIIIQEVGAISDDGNAWVDKNSGYKIKSIDFNTDEGYDDGFKVTSREIMEQDAGDAIISASTVNNEKNSKITIKYDSPQVQVISNIITTFSSSMGIHLEDQREFIINNVINILRTSIPSEKDYTNTVKEMANKGKNISSYKDFYNTSLLYFTMGLILIGIQTNIPSIKTRKTFPGCVRSFNGYPFEGNGDLSSVNYLSCVAYKIRSVTEPWNVLSRTNEATIALKMKGYIDKFLYNIPEVKTKIDKKIEYLLTNPEEDIPLEHDLKAWSHFLPPLFPYKIKNLVNISSEFKHALLNDVKHGYKNQRDKILIVESKILFFSLAIQEKIQKIIHNKKLILTNSANEPFLENACCVENSIYSAIQYFIKEDNEISSFNTIVKELNNILLDINNITKASLFSSKINTKNVYPIISNEFSEETIYLAFISYCKFKTLVPISEDLLPLCSNKPEYFSMKKSLIENIRELKKDGRIYNNEQFLRLLQIVNRQNIMDISYYNNEVTTLQKLRDILNSVNVNIPNSSDIITPKLKLLMENALDTFDIAVTGDVKETRDLNNYIITKNNTFKTEIIDFIKRNAINTNKRIINNMERFMNSFSIWKASNTEENDNIKHDKKEKKEKKEDPHSISNDSLYNEINFYKSFIHNFLYIFPNIISNNVDYQDTLIPNYWGLSQIHKTDIKKVISNYYAKLKPFYQNVSLFNIFVNIQNDCKNVLLLTKETPCFSSIHYKDKEIQSVFNERTSRLLFEHYLLFSLVKYIQLSNDENMLKRESNKVYENETEENISQLFIGDKKELKQHVAALLLTFIQIMQNDKENIDTSYEEIMDRVFKLKELEKDTFTDRLKELTDEQRDVDTVLKINKLGVWSKGLQKGLVSYDKDNYDEEREVMDKILATERIIRRTNQDVTDNNIDNYLDDYLEQQDRDMEIEREEYNISAFTEDYMDGNNDGEEVDDYEDYN